MSRLEASVWDIIILLDTKIDSICLPILSKASSLNIGHESKFLIDVEEDSKG